MKKEILLLTLLILLPVISAQNITYELDWDKDDVYYGRDFNIEIDIFNLENQTYDLKVWVESDESTVLTEIYDDENDEWKSGVYYVNEFFQGPGDFSEEVELKIKDEHKSFTGRATLYLRLRDLPKIEESIKVLEPPEPEQTITPLKTIKQESFPEPPRIIQLSNIIKNSSENSTQEQETIKTNNNTIYESQTEIIKKYSIASFAFFCVIFTILITWNKLD